MSWTLSIWVAVAVLALCRGQNPVYEGNSLSASGYHLCVHNETRMVSFLVMHKVPYTVTQPCGGWLLWTTCTVTLYKMIPRTENKTVMEQVTKCCDGYVQVGRYCALCPANYSENGGYRWNATVTVKTDYQQLMSKVKGLLNHTRLLQAMVTGALQSDDVSVYYLSSWPVHPYRTATSLLIDCNFTLSLHNVTSKLHLLLKHIQEVSSVTVEDVDECVEPALHQCSAQADCNNTVGSYQCSCRQGYIDVDPSDPAAHCSAGNGVWTTTDTPLTYLPPMNTTYTPASNTTQAPPGNSTTGTFNSSEISMTTALSNTSSVSYNTSHALQWTTSAPYISMSSTVEIPLPTTTCSPPNITALTSSNVTGTSFCVYWSSQFLTNQTYRVVLSNGSQVIRSWETNQTMIEVRRLEPGVLYIVTITPCACGIQGDTLRISVKTDAQTLDATARLTNVNFTADLQNSSSQAYKNLTASIIEEIYKSLSPEMKAMVRIEIRSLSVGSVVVHFTLIFTPSQSQDISNVSVALLNSLMNSSKFTVDSNNTSITDFNECTSGENDCSQWASCSNTWASYTCECLDRFIDNNPERPGRACQANATLETMTPSPTPTIYSTVSTTSFSLMTPSTSDPALTTGTTTPGITKVIISTSEMVSTASTPTTTPAIPTTTTAIPTTTTAIPTTTTAAPTTTPAIPTTTTAAPITTTAALTTTTAAPTTITTTCRVAATTVTVARDFLLNSKIRESTLYLGLQDCGVNGGNGTHAQLTVAWNECATMLVQNDTHYTTSVTLFNKMDPYTSSSGSEEVPRVHLEVPIKCTYMKSMLISADSGSMGYDMIKDVIAGLGSFQVTVQLMNGTVPLPHNYSLSAEEAVVVDVSLNTSSEQIKVVIDRCWATPTMNPADSHSYTFLENSCSLNAYTKVLMNGTSSTSRLSVQIFSFVNLDVIYLHCQVYICVQIGSDTCVPDCLQRTGRSSNNLRTAVGSYGPLLRIYDDTLEQEYDTVHIIGFSCLGVGLLLFLVVAFICLFYYQRNRIGHYNFTVKPKQENFTYLVFNT
ncbi:putative uromodulin-like 1 [Scophthalmus maximus]|uniref:Putative uromodulin-like 1 n=1 Tax=Scophthalmus maximus TaxID=52904 RepID=A0A2U9B9I3_SCOMX|nr:putative uromodulin-like 1 [Scophthalmus maximus]